MKVSFDRVSDFMPADRKKLIHSQGVVGHFKWIPTDNAQNYTGVFRSGSDFTIVRLSAAV